jgi:hypothetical protein
MPKVDNTDVYAFRSYEPGREGFVTIISNFQPFQEPGGGPNYFTLDENAVYEIMVDSNGDAVEDKTFQFTFGNRLSNNGRGCTIGAGGKELPLPTRTGAGEVSGDEDPEVCERETYAVKMITGDRRSGTAADVSSGSGGMTRFVKPLDNIGAKTFDERSGGYEGYANRFIYNISIPGCSGQGRMFVGQREEAFAVNLGPIFDTLNLTPIAEGSDPVYGNGTNSAGMPQSDFNQELMDRPDTANYNVTSIAMEVPISCLTADGNGVIGVWSSASLPQTRALNPNPTYLSPDTQGGSLVQVSRLGNPLVNEVVIGLPDKNLFNAAKPTQDVALADYVTNPTYPEYIERLFGGAGALAPNNFPRADLVATFLTGIASLNQQASVTPSEMLRLNTAVNPTPQAAQKTLGVVADDLAGFPNGRRPGDDVVDIVLRVAMGRLCHPVPIAGKPTDLGLCKPSDAPAGLVPFTDGAPTNANRTMNRFPYLNLPLRGAPRPQTQP